MNLARLVRRELVLPEMETLDLPDEEREEIPPDRYLLRQKERIVDELVGLLERSGRVANRNKLATDLYHREKKAGTGLKHGLAVPHVRTIHAKEFLLGIARSTPGLEFGCLDGRPAHLFFVMVAPPWDDHDYLRVYRQLAEAFSVQGEELLRRFLEAEDEGEILRAVRQLD